MEAEKVITIIFWLIVSSLWAMNIWGGWAERFYQKKKDAYWPWHWLRIFRVELTERNCILFLKGSSVVGFILLSVGSIAVLFRGN